MDFLVGINEELIKMLLFISNSITINKNDDFSLKIFF